MIARKIKNSEEALKLLKEILRDDGKPQDFAGNTRLTLLADKIKSLPRENSERSSYIRAIRKCADLLDEFSVLEVRNLCNLIYLTELPHNEYVDAFLESFKRWKTTSDNVEQRAEVFRLIGESGAAKIDYSVISGETKIKKEFPWHWIDVAVYLDRDSAISSVKEWVKTNKNFTPIIQRLPHWWGLYEIKEKEEYYEMLSDLLKDAAPEDVETVRLFLESIEVPANEIAKITKSDILLDTKAINFLKGTFKENYSYPTILEVYA